MWSLGILVLQVQCGLQVVNRALKLPASAASLEQTARIIAEGLCSAEAVRNLASEHSLTEMRNLRLTLKGLACNDLKRDAFERCPTATVVGVLGCIFTAAPTTSAAAAGGRPQVISFSGSLSAFNQQPVFVAIVLFLCLVMRS